MCSQTFSSVNRIHRRKRLWPRPTTYLCMSYVLLNKYLNFIVKGPRTSVAIVRVCDVFWFVCMIEEGFLFQLPVLVRPHPEYWSVIGWGLSVTGCCQLPVVVSYRLLSVAENLDYCITAVAVVNYPNNGQKTTNQK